MRNQWFRMYAEFANDAKVQMLPENMQRRIVMLLCIRCNGDVTLHDDEIAFQLRVSSQDWIETKALFVAKNFITEDNKIVNWAKRQYVSDSSTQRVKAHREKKKQERNVSVTPPDTEQIQNRTDKKESGAKTPPAPPQGYEKAMEEEKTPFVRAGNGWRLTEHWELCELWGRWAVNEFGLSTDRIITEAKKFHDHFTSKDAKKPIKIDWPTAWRNWMRTATGTSKRAA